MIPTPNLEQLLRGCNVAREADRELTALIAEVVRLTEELAAREREIEQQSAHTLRCVCNAIDDVRGIELSAKAELESRISHRLKHDPKPEADVDAGEHQTPSPAESVTVDTPPASSLERDTMQCQDSISGCLATNDIDIVYRCVLASGHPGSHKTEGGLEWQPARDTPLASSSGDKLALALKALQESYIKLTGIWPPRLQEVSEAKVAIRQAIDTLSEPQEDWKAKYESAQAELDNPLFMYAGGRIRREAIACRNEEIDAYASKSIALQKIIGVQGAGERNEHVESRARELVQAEIERDRLKREILAAGNSEFDWSVLERLDRLEEAEAERDRLRAELDAAHKALGSAKALDKCETLAAKATVAMTQARMADRLDFEARNLRTENQRLQAARDTSKDCHFTIQLNAMYLDAVEYHENAIEGTGEKRAFRDAAYENWPRIFAMLQGKSADGQRTWHDFSRNARFFVWGFNPNDVIWFDTDKPTAVDAGGNTQTLESVLDHGVVGNEWIELRQPSKSEEAPADCWVVLNCWDVIKVDDMTCAQALDNPWRFPASETIGKSVGHQIIKRRVIKSRDIAKLQAENAELKTENARLNPLAGDAGAFRLRAESAEKQLAEAKAALTIAKQQNEAGLRSLRESGTRIAELKERASDIDKYRGESQIFRDERDRWRQAFGKARGLLSRVLGFFEDIKHGKATGFDKKALIDFLAKYPETTSWICLQCGLRFATREIVEHHAAQHGPGARFGCGNEFYSIPRDDLHKPAPKPDDACVWCRHPESEHGKPGESPMGTPTDRLCPVPGVSSQFYTPKKALQPDAVEAALTGLRRWDDDKPFSKWVIACIEALVAKVRK